MNPFPRGPKIPKPPDRITIFPHLEMGDQLISNAICRHYAAQGRTMTWLCDVKYVFDVRRMFEDLPKVEVFGALGYGDVQHRWLPATPGDHAVKLGMFANGFNIKKWDQEFYRQAGLPFDARWTGFRLPPSLRLAEPSLKEKVALMHEDRARNFMLIKQLIPKELKQIIITKRKSFWDWLPEVLSSKELHFIDSSFLNLADSLYGLGYLRNTKLVYHKYAKSYSDAGPPQLRAPWHIIQ
jgi:hypothetical protein